LEGRVILPFETGTRFGTVFGVPMSIHIGPVVRLDTGIFIPLLFYDSTIIAFDVPFDAWFQVGPKLWLGPMVGFRHWEFGRLGPSRDDLRFGFGLGYQVARIVDLKTQLFFPQVNHDHGAETFGAGFGVQIRIE